MKNIILILLTTILVSCSNFGESECDGKWAEGSTYYEITNEKTPLCYFTSIVYLSLADDNGEIHARMNANVLTASTVYIKSYGENFKKGEKYEGVGVYDKNKDNIYLDLPMGDDNNGTSWTNTVVKSSFVIDDIDETAGIVTGTLEYSYVDNNPSDKGKTRSFIIEYDDFELHK